MDYVFKILKKVSIKGTIVHLVGLIASMAIIWGVSYLILVTFSIQENPVVIPDEPIKQAKVVTSTTKSKVATSTHATTTATSTKSKK